MSGVSRSKICYFELGVPCLTPEEQYRIHDALSSEVERLRELIERFHRDQASVTKAAREGGAVLIVKPDDCP